MYPTEYEKTLGSTLEERRAALQDTTRFDYDGKTGLYVSKDGKHRFNEDTDEIVSANLDMSFGDIKKMRERENPAYINPYRTGFGI